MPKNTHDKNDVKTLGLVLRRTNYNEADRILNIITPLGKKTAIAKGVRKAKSKMAGGVEMFTLAEYNLHFGKGEMGVVTGVRMIRHFSEIIKDYGRIELAGTILKNIARAAEGSDNPEYFNIANQSLTALNGGANTKLVEAWFWLNLKKASGEEVNLYRDAEGVKLQADLKYDWDFQNETFVAKTTGKYAANEIKLLRLMTSTELNMARRIKLDQEVLDKVWDFTSGISKV